MTKQVRAMETRRSIVAAAARVFVEHGFAGASLSDIAAQAGVTKGALYFHFPSKTALASAMILAQQEANAALEEQVRAYRGDHLILLQRITGELAQRMIDDPTLRAAMRLAVELGEDEDRGISETYGAWEALVARVAATARERGEIGEQIDPERLARFLVAAFTGLQTVSLVSSGLDDLQDRVADMWQLLLPGLSAA